MNDKLQRIKNLIERKRIDLLLLSTEPNTRYLTGKYKLNCLIAIPNKTEPFIVTSITGKTELENSAFEVFSFSPKYNSDIKAETHLEALKKLIKLKHFKVRLLAYERDILSYKYSEKIKKQFNCKFFDISDELFQIRSIKNSEEIKILKAAARLTCKAMKLAKENIKVGISERELAALVEFDMRKRADWYSFETIIASGPNSAFPHHQVSDRKIKKNDLVVVDCGMIYKGYCSDMTRTFCMKKDKKIESIYNTVLSARKTVLSKIKANVKAKTIDDVARKIIEKSGYRLVHGIGHGVGMEIHEEPSIRYDSKSVLKPGMVFTVEPGIYVTGLGGVRIEDMVLLTKKGIEILTKFPRVMT